MTVAELIDILQDYEPYTEVRLAFQPKWPFEYSIGEVVSAYTIDHDSPFPPTEIVYIAEGEQIDYLNDDAITQLEWL